MSRLIMLETPIKFEGREDLPPRNGRGKMWLPSTFYTYR